MSSDVTDDLWLVYRIADRQFECALWQLRDGEWALSLFLSQEKAERYRVEFGLADWHSRNLPRADLLEVIRACRASGVKFAVLDPDRQQARVIFDLSAVLRQVGFENESRPS